MHRFEKFVRNGMSYYQLATTGGGSKMRGMDYREFDHITWVTMKSEGPTIAHVLLDGVLPEDLKRTPTAEEGVVVYNRKPPQPARGKVLFNGAPPVGAKIVFNQVDDKKKVLPIADAQVEADGTFVLSSYIASDGGLVCLALERIEVGSQKGTLIAAWRQLPSLRDPGATRSETSPRSFARRRDAAGGQSVAGEVRVGVHDRSDRDGANGAERVRVQFDAVTWRVYV